MPYHFVLLNYMKNVKTILFASLIAAMILPFSGMQFAAAETVDELYEYPPEHNEYNHHAEIDMESLDREIAKYERQLENARSDEAREKIEERLVRALLIKELAQLQAQDTHHYSTYEQRQHQQTVNNTLDKLMDTYDESDRYTMTTNSDSQSEHNFLVNYPELDFRTNSEYRYHCSANSNLPGFCLLYTSPSPRDAHESRMPSSA